MAYNKETGMYEGFIYIIENTINDKKYIGQTITTIDNRWSGHIALSKRKDHCMIICKAINKYGIENFSIREIDCVCDNNKKNLLDQLNDKEVYYISSFNSLTPNGYNLTKGGNNISESIKVPVSMYSFDGELLDNFDSMTDAAGYCGSNTTTAISMCCNGELKTAYGYVWRYFEDDFDKFSIEKIDTRKVVTQYDLEGNFQNVFPSIAEAIRYLGKSKNMGGHIADVCSGKRHYAFGYVWRYGDDPYDKYQVSKDIIIEQRDFKTGELIATFNGYKEAADLTRSNKSCINMCCLGKQQYHNGYIWCLQGKFNEDLKITAIEKPVAQYTIYGELIRCYNSIAEASRITSINRCSIDDSCLGKAISGGGFIWRYSCDDFNKYEVDLDKLNRYRKINQYNKDGVFMQTFNNPTEAKLSLGKKSASEITGCCNGEAMTTYGFMWFWSDDPNQPDKSKIIN